MGSLVRFFRTEGPSFVEHKKRCTSLVRIFLRFEKGDTTTNFGGIYFHVFGVMLVEAFSVRTSPQTFLGLGKVRWGESSELAAWFPVGAHTRGTLKRPEILSILSHSLAQSAPASQDEEGLRSASGGIRSNNRQKQLPESNLGEKCSGTIWV